MTDTTFDNILAIDTSTRRLLLALAFGGDRLIKSSDVVEKSHGQLLLKKIDNLFVSADLSVSDLDAVVVALGPGSFTGLRIGLAAAKGLAEAGGLPMVGISLFDLAARLLRQQQPPAYVLIPSRKGEWYVGTLDQSGIAESNVRVIAENELPAITADRPVYGIGFDPAAVLPFLSGSTGQGRLEYDGADLLYLGREKLERGEVDDVAALEPMYLQKAIAEARFEQRQQQKQ